MTREHRPRLPLPPPLRGAEIGSFAHNTIVVRLPDIAWRVLAENDFPPDVAARLEALIDELPDGRIRPLADGHDWDDYTAVYPHHTWLDVPWFFAENYFYRRILEATGYFGQGPLAGLDPFAYQKKLGLETAVANIRALAVQMETWLAQGWDEIIFGQLLAVDLWGNQADLSLWPADGQGQPNHADHSTRQAHLLVDDTTAVTNHLTNHPTNQPLRLDFLIDNAGFELLGDLCLADYWLGSSHRNTVRFHLKIHPTFVSDALVSDVLAAIEFLGQDKDVRVQNLAERLRQYWQNGRLQCHYHPFWTSPLPGWEMPPDLRRQLAGASLIISKGDALYRRLLGDRHWPFTTPFADIVSYLTAPLVALRTLKSEVATGLKPDQITALNQKDPNWLTNGRWGVIQFTRA